MRSRIGELAEALTEGLRRSGMPEALASMVHVQIEEALSSEQFRSFLASQEKVPAKDVLGKLALRFDPLHFQVDVDYKN
jgi:hypothetical protein